MQGRRAILRFAISKPQACRRPIHTWFRNTTAFPPASPDVETSGCRKDKPAESGLTNTYISQPPSGGLVLLAGGLQLPARNGSTWCSRTCRVALSLCDLCVLAVYISLPFFRISNVAKCRFSGIISRICGSEMASTGEADFILRAVAPNNHAKMGTAINAKNNQPALAYAA